MARADWSGYKWIGEKSDAAVVLATLLALYLRAMDEDRDTELAESGLREALDEFYALHPHLAGVL